MTRPFATDGPVIHRFKPFCASKVWRFPDPDTGYMNAAENRADLVRSIVSYRANNRLAPIEHLDLVLENYLAGLPENCGETEPHQLKRGFLLSVKGGISLLEWVMFPEELTATPEQADTRAAQCARCPCNVFPDKNIFIQWCDDIALACVGNKRTQYAKDLGNCEVCSCVLNAAVWYNGDPQFDDEQKKKAKSVDCWKMKYYEGKNG